MKRTETILKISDLQVAFERGKRSLPVIEGLNLELLRGKVLGLVGESGCGKSMTALSVLRLLPSGGRITGGEILLDNENLLELSKGEMRRIRGKRIGMIFQDPNSALNPVRRVGSQFIETLQTHLSLERPKAKMMAESMLSTLGLSGPERLMRCYPFQLSGGMRQRVMIALALSLQPDVLLADEPTTALDVTVQAQILAEMKKLQDQFKTAILLVSHNLGVIAQLCDEVAVMYGGTIVETGTVEALFTQTAHPYTQGLLYAIPHLYKSRGQTLSIIKGQPPEAGRIPQGCPFAPRCGAALEICRRSRPTLQQTGDDPGHQRACHFPLTWTAKQHTAQSLSRKVVSS
ncbi:ABC transporter ATP-binding protein [Desulfosporosinus meridiei]|uniref:Oligopeptide/dipeptide ABC transporter, ATP-binding protein n=1 Tax=Desulfosporosinus meridiei (strain ATCC BAA-275 / DSM 13257 / KCTC 12902 / NCIMB 13706 / S10) TaxID=768704 RepID=J7IU04_DESMD|nr:ABC transporter ATP-binding protein [Desulfosporosinus meridiei]AFQ42603.1 oligopeptide/dipeptide ABC transporter, ATP-binding protein [Desulfosporosinus meridiei DSM 13257]